MLEIIISFKIYTYHFYQETTPVAYTYAYEFILKIYCKLKLSNSYILCGLRLKNKSEKMTIPLQDDLICNSFWENFINKQNSSSPIFYFFFLFFFLYTRISWTFRNNIFKEKCTIFFFFLWTTSVLIIIFGL